VEKDYYTIPGAAKICSVGRTTMWRWVKKGYIKTCMTLGGRHRIRKTDLDDVLAENRAYRMPVANAQPEMQSAPESASQSFKILIVDDDPQILKMMAKLLTTRGYETAIASDGFEAGIRAMEFNPDLIVLDLVMPGMDGFEVCKRIKENPSTSHIKVLAISGYDTEENREKIMKAGADGYLAKPADMDVLAGEIEGLLADWGGGR